jgi:hypothetical protein
MKSSVRKASGEGGSHSMAVTAPPRYAGRADGLMRGKLTRGSDICRQSPSVHEPGVPTARTVGFCVATFSLAMASGVCCANDTVGRSATAAAAASTGLRRLRACRLRLCAPFRATGKGAGSAAKAGAGGRATICRSPAWMD